jgi:hypothetical protein
MIRCLLFLAIAALSQIDETVAFVTNNIRATSLSTCSPSNSLLLAKKKKNNTGGKGFGKETETPTKPASNNSNSQDLFNMDARAAAQQQASVFTSVDGGSDTIPTLSMEQSQTTSSSSGNIEDRTGSILRDKYGLRTREEQEAEEAKKKKMQEQRQQLNEWKRQADDGDDFDLLRIIPDPILIFIDKFLKVGVAVCTLLFLLAGVLITIEAGSKATSNPLPAEFDAFIANVVEPNFTPGLGVLLSFSVGLGLFASLQLNSAASTYREDK